MLPQNSSNGLHNVHNSAQHQISSFAPSNPNPAFDQSAQYFNLDPSQAAKQMAALNAASHARMMNGRSSVPSASLPLNGTNSGAYLGGTPQVNIPAAPSMGHDPLANNHSLIQSQNALHMTNNHALPQATPNSAGNPPFFDSPSAMAQSNPAARAAMLKSRQQFLNGLASVHQKRSTPLPPQLTGVTTNPAYDPMNTQWKSLEGMISEPGVLRIVGKDIDLMRLWSMVLQLGGFGSVNGNNSWNVVLQQLGLPEFVPQPQGNSVSVAAFLSQHYGAIMYPFEEAYNMNMKDQQRKAQLAARQTGAPGQPGQQNHGMSPRPNQQNTPMAPSTPGPQPQGSTGGSRLQAPQTPNAPHTPMAATQNSNLRTPTQGTPQKFPTNSSSDSQQAPDVNVLDGDYQGLKRKLESGDSDNKRAKQKTGKVSEIRLGPGVDRNSVGPSGTTTTTPSQAPPMPIPPRARPQPSRRKIEYVPLAREIETSGGRDLRIIEAEYATLHHRRPWRDINDWGIVDIEGLTMSIRSRLATEMSYALTTLTFLSTMRGQAPGSGFPIYQCTDLFEELLDLMEDIGFGEAMDGVKDELDDSSIITHRQLVNAYQEVQTEPFAVLHPKQGAKDSSLGPRPRPANLIITVMNIIRNLTTIADNLEYIARQDRLFDIMLRLCSVERSADGTLRASSPVLSIGDVIAIRKDTLYTLETAAYVTHFPTTMPPSKPTLRMANRVFDLISSYLVDPTEAVSPLACVQVAGAPANVRLGPPSLPDVALEVWTRISQSDGNRQVFAHAVSQVGLWRLIESLVHRLPVVDADFQLLQRGESWLSYVEKAILGLYSLAFLSPPELKRRIKADRKLGFTGVMFRMVQKFLMVSHEYRQLFVICLRRIIETMKIVDDGEDLFDTTKSTTVPPLSFGMGFSEAGENASDKGTGLLGGYRGIAWDMLMVREVAMDELIFNELESLARVE
ncbi:hypothetical protein PLEOSDRAFT_38448 [Pleurotus ostreatus PC15]|uniref:ARID domain-containing protein n=1 Tax=Pleurotus ostreatus (strain PC15) TaxID=1137138 RepID=A0A067NRS7_PLEO1|nr:hypothetical protein PLEOSDRAFT_38448 [Pleurotus ostreatus PC15]